eukprot:gnl/TRDRNA2_/TRDRNA2_174277_c0_seq13.p1 gnl/TRDRNA2_/TRDRNA2_174277_c0~~gnl/TRDRNA2_/TRDRNA2_174277_c0_seq13.p1  ORF type:complete len:733 (+),score=121.86 gnl/TRDRNA2_/TRDRNA2_174277_c0_seq13:54-2252(+)
MASMEHPVRISTRILTVLVLALSAPALHATSSSEESCDEVDSAMAESQEVSGLSLLQTKMNIVRKVGSDESSAELSDDKEEEGGEDGKVKENEDENEDENEEPSLVQGEKDDDKNAADEDEEDDMEEGRIVDFTALHWCKDRGDTQIFITPPGLEGQDKEECTPGAFNANQPDSKRTRKVWHRPMIKKWLRCRGPDQASCEECTAGACWETCQLTKPFGDMQVPQGYCIDHQDGQWMRYLMLVHVSCGVEAQMTADIAELVDGQLNVLWDGIDVRQDQGFRTEGVLNRGSPFNPHDFKEVPLDYNWKGVRGHRFVARLLAGHYNPHGGGKRVGTAAGGHDLVFEFTPSKIGARVKMKKMAIFVLPEYAGCMDNKSCLKDLTGTGGVQLRSTNSFQIACLEGKDLPTAELKDACISWTACLDAAGTFRKQEILTILKAAGITSGSSLVQSDAPVTCKDGGSVKLVDGETFTVSGTWKRGQKRFGINFDVPGDKSKILFHFNARQGFKGENHIVRNSKNRDWGDREAAGGLAGLSIGKSFTIDFKYTSAKWEVTINGHRHGGVFDFYHRIQASNTCVRVGSIDNPKITMKVSSTPKVADSRTTAASADLSVSDAPEDGCIHPPTEDPLAWDCDCYEEMLERCHQLKSTLDYTVDEQDCLTAQYCEFQRICPAWQQESCHKSPIPQLRIALNSKMMLEQQNALLADRALNGSGRALLVKREATGMDKSLGGKRCK